MNKKHKWPTPEEMGVSDPDPHHRDIAKRAGLLLEQHKSVLKRSSYTRGNEIARIKDSAVLLLEEYGVPWIIVIAF